MAISPPSDIVLDVAKAIDPMSYTEAVGRLRRAAAVAGAAPNGFEGVFDGMVNGSPRVLSDAGASLTTRANNQVLFGGQQLSARDRAYQNFEAMALTTFVQTMLPDNADAVFGSGTAGSVWRSLLAEKIAGQMAAAGGIGIADQMRAADDRRQAGLNGSADVPATDETLAVPAPDRTTLLDDVLASVSLPLGLGVAGLSE